jgi:predicted TIM-barrel fold metal-dependent hydrolase
MKHHWFVATAAIALVAVHIWVKGTSVYAQQGPGDNTGFTDAELQQFAALNPIDTHTHIYKTDPIFVAMLARLHLHTVDIVDVSDNANVERKNLDKENNDVFDLVHHSNGHVFACTTFDPYRFSEPGFTAASIRSLDQSFDRGAIAVKVWKNVGMEVKNAKGQFILPDDSALEPIYRDIARHNKTLITHIADLDTAWTAPDPTAPDQSYYRQHPEWSMYNVPAAPTKQQILDARDRVLKMNPNLRMVGAHFGSMETDFVQLAKDLDRYPNFAVDMASRLNYLQRLPREQAIAFVLKYQDRLIYGTDDTLYPEQDTAKYVKSSEASYARDWRYLSMDKVSSSRGREFQGLALPQGVLRKLYHDNAMHWFPGLK